MAFDINRYLEKKNKGFFRKLKHYWKKYQHYNKMQYSKIDKEKAKINSQNIENINKKRDDIISTIVLLVLLTAFILCKPFRLEILNIIKPVCNIVITALFYIIPIIAVIIFIWLAMTVYETEKNIDDNFKNSSKINFKKGFNRLNVIIAIICTLLFILLYGLIQYGNYQIIVEYSSNVNKLWEFIRYITLLIFYPLLFYSVFRLIFLGFLKCIDWILIGFKNE